jgi:hypothetical protein
MTMWYNSDKLSYNSLFLHEYFCRFIDVDGIEFGSAASLKFFSE